MISSPEVSQRLKRGTTSARKHWRTLSHPLRWEVESGFIHYECCFGSVCHSHSCWSNHFLCCRRRGAVRREGSSQAGSCRPYQGSPRRRVSVCLKSRLKDYIYTTVQQYSTRISPKFSHRLAGKAEANLFLLHRRENAEKLTELKCMKKTKTSAMLLLLALVTFDFTKGLRGYALKFHRVFRDSIKCLLQVFQAYGVKSRPGSVCV